MQLFMMGSYQIIDAHLKAFGLRQQKIKASEPVGEDEQDVNEVDDSPKIRPHRSALNNVIIFNSSINLQRVVGRE